MPPPTSGLQKKPQAPGFLLAVPAPRRGLRSLRAAVVELPGQGSSPCPHGRRLQLLLVPGDQAVRIGRSVWAVRLLNTRVGTFFASLSQQFVFSLPACLLRVVLGAPAVCRLGTARFSQGAVLALLMLCVALLLGRRSGRLEKRQLEVVVPLPRNQNKKYIWKWIPHPCAKKEEKQPLSSRKDGKRRREGGSYLSCWQGRRRVWSLSASELPHPGLHF